MHTRVLRSCMLARLQVEGEAEELKSIKDEIADNEQQQMEARSEAAAQRMLLEEDAELRKAIQVCCVPCLHGRLFVLMYTRLSCFQS